MRYRTPLSRARGLGSAKEGLGHWWAQRVTAVALIPLTIWFVASLIRLAGADYEAYQAWLALPANAGLLLMLIGLGLHHAHLGVQVVVEDYVARRALRLPGIWLVKGIALLIGMTAALSILKVAFGG